MDRELRLEKLEHQLAHVLYGHERVMKLPIPVISVSIDLKFNLQEENVHFHL